MTTVNTTVKRDVLSKAISTAAKAVSPNPVTPLLGTILLQSGKEQGMVSATNFELGISYTFPVKGEEFKTCVPAKMFSALVDVLHTDEIEIRLNQFDQSAIIMTDSSTSNIKCAAADEFPIIPTVTKPQVVMPVAQFKEMVQRVAFASNPTSETVLAGVQVMTENKNIIMFATDGYHLSYEEFALKKAAKVNVIVKGTTLELISRILPDEGDIEIQAEGNKIMFHCENVHVVSQLLNGNYPDHTMLKKGIGKAKTDVTISTIELFRACRQLKVFSADTGKTRLDINGLVIRYSTITQDKGDADVTLAAVTKGAPIVVGLNVHLLYNFLEICKTAQVQIEFVSPQAPIVLKMEGYRNFYHVIMPVVL